MGQMFVFILFYIFMGVSWAKSDGFQLGIRDSIMIAHSFKGEEFGPAQATHGATYTVDVDFHADKLVDRLNWVIDIGAASDLVSDVLGKYNFKNLDDVFPEENTTTEFMCKAIHTDLKTRLRAAKSFKGKVTVKLHESHKAWASFSDDV
jgi:6-pyruvoyltetrahydropterin/6-carboxytetrahydropterin synthase